MEGSQELRALIEKTDDDYLIGLSNKGTLKRAYKDLEQEIPALTWQGNKARVALKEETCLIAAPLGESTCSCPSRSVCRHVVTAILWLRRELHEDPEEQAEERPVDNGALTSLPEGPAGTPVPGSGAPAELQEILSIPADRLKRACGGKGFRAFLAHMRAGERPAIEESSIVTVTLPWEKATVKLLEPFDYSTCTCHSRELCAHKAQAVLAYQAAKGRIRLESLEQMQDKEESWDLELTSRTGEQVHGALCRQIGTGLSRQSRDVTEELERLAVLSHRAGLPALESGLRELAGAYERYFSRSASFREEEFRRKLLEACERAAHIQRAKTQEELRPLAGVFRDSYEPVGKLHLTGMGGRSFSSKTGYEGEIYYFLETRKREWYTWTDVRPVFYEGVKRRPPSAAEQAQAPWGLTCSREKMQELKLELTNAKAAPGGRLSVSRDTKAEIAGSRDPEDEGIREMTFWNYENLLDHYFGGRAIREEGDAVRRERLCLVGAVRWDRTDFDFIQQRFSWSIYDIMGKKLFISLTYTKEEKMTIRLLERLEQRLRNRFQGTILFFGSLYLDEESRMCLFPIEIFLREHQGPPAEPGTLSDAHEMPLAEPVETFSDFCRQAMDQLSDLMVSGLFSVQEDTLRQLGRLGDEAEELGLHGAAGELETITDLLKGKRHQMEFSPEKTIEAMGRLNRYLLACREKISYDMAGLAMKKEESAG